MSRRDVIARCVVACFAAQGLACSSAPVDGSLLLYPGTPYSSASSADGGSAWAGDAASSSTTGAGGGTYSSADAGTGSTTSGDGGTNGATAAGSEAGSVASCAGAVVCDDFENQTIEPADAGGAWYVSTPDCSGTGAIAIDATQAHSGTHSLKVTGTAGYCNHVFLATASPAQVTGPLWARFYVRLSTALTSDHATFLAMRDSTSSSDLRMGGQDGVLMFNRQSDDATLPEMSPQGTALSVVPSVNAWHCVEFNVDGAGPTLQTWVDGTAVSGLVVGPSASSDADGQWKTDTAWAPKLSDARFGWESYAGESETLWFDDIALGASRIGCD